MQWLYHDRGIVPLVGKLPHQQAAELIPNPNPNVTQARALDLALGPRPNRNPKQAAEHLTTPQNDFTNRLARPLLQNFFRCAGQICSALRRTNLSWGEARRKRLQVRRKSTKTRSSPRRFWNSRSRSSILNGAPV